MKKEQILLVAWNCMLAYNPNKEISHPVCDWALENFVDECQRVYQLSIQSEYVNWYDMENFWNTKANEKPTTQYIVVELTGEESNLNELFNIYQIKSESKEVILNIAYKEELTIDYLKILSLDEIQTLNKN